MGIIDGRSHEGEARLGTGANRWDTDRDGLGDAVDPWRSAADGDGDGTSDPDELGLGLDPQEPDTDRDGLGDAYEAHVGADPLDGDTDRDGLGDAYEAHVGADPLDGDTDDDGLTDGQETVWLGTDPAAVDTDGDGLTDSREALIGTDPRAVDTDGDGLRTDTFDGGWGDRATDDFPQGVVEGPTDGEFASYQADGLAQVLEPRDDDGPISDAPVTALDPADPTVPDLFAEGEAAVAPPEVVLDAASGDDAVVVEDPGFALVTADALDDDLLA